MTRQNGIDGELDWRHAVVDIPESGLAITRDADASELKHIADALDLCACDSLTVSYAIHPRGDGRYLLTGDLRAKVEQVCVVTLEPMTSALHELFEVPFWPEQEVPSPAGGELDLSYDRDPQPIIDGSIDVGRVVFECLAESIDLYPRVPGAMLEQQSAGPSRETAGATGSPFAVLAKIKGNT